MLGVDWPGIGETTPTECLYNLKVAYLIFKKAAPILQKAHRLHYKDEPENAFYLGGKKHCFSGNHTKSTIQLFVQGIKQNSQSICLFWGSFKIHSPTVCSGNHSKSTVQLFVQGITRNPQPNCLFRESYKIRNTALFSGNHSKSTVELFVQGIIQNPQPIVLKNAQIIAETYATCSNNYELQTQKMTILSVLCLQRYCVCIAMTARLNSTACSTWVVLPSRLSLWLHQQSYGSLPRSNPSPWATARLSFVSLFMIGLVACLFCNDNSTPLSPPAPFLSLYQCHPEATTGAWDSLSNLFLNKIYCEFCGSEVNIWFR